MTEQDDVAQVVAASVAERLRTHGVGNGSQPGCGVQTALGREVVAATGRYAVRACSEVAAEGTPPVAVVVVVLERTPSAAEVRRRLAERYGFTPREAAVAWLLVRRLSTAEIAQALGVSRHTARHHVEHVLAKLGVRSRAAAAARLVADAPAPALDSS